ncbi:MAG: DUF1929 domain-containing protein [Scytonematopsis contorta HA4267-MV1]|jgi:hypothetical protein|nr:DUF1929 domain-containing protein [Scytonematopsis contorta HA4267-MV1]
MPWQISSTCPINPVHAAVLRTGKILFFAGSGNDPNNVANSSQGAAVWDINTGNFTRPQIPVRADGSIIDVFCAGQSFRPNGRLFVAGGTLQYDPFFGTQESFVFDPPAERWIQVASMKRFRWYPTVLTLGSGRILAVSGLDEANRLVRQQEVFVGGTTGWSLFTTQTSPFALYAHLFLLSSGKIFYSGAQLGGNNGVPPTILTLPSNFSAAIGEQAVSGLQAPDSANQAASVLLPPAQDQRVMILGGGDGNGNATNRVNIVDLKQSSPTYTSAPPLNNPRMHHNAVILPNRTVFVCNGSRADENVAQSTFPAEIFDPATNTWSLAETPNINGRVYHSVALLIPDGRVVVAGGNPTRGTFEARIEIYIPPYISQTRPTIQNAPRSIRYTTGRITIDTVQAQTIKWVHIVRPMAPTHGMDTDQRLVDMPITARTGTSLTVQVPNNRNLAPPGFYMLFIVDNNNIPSVATWIQLT